MSKPNPKVYIPTLYFAEGLPYAIVMSLSTVYFKSLGASNVFIGLATIISLPWTLKFIWAPLVDFYATKRAWLLVSQLILGILVIFLAGSAFSPEVVNTSLLVFLFIAFASATHDIAIDGYYLDVLNKEQQAFYVGVRNAAYKVAVLFVSGAMVYLAGLVEKQSNLQTGWAVSFLVLALCLIVCFLFHLAYLPKYQIKNNKKNLSLNHDISENSISSQEIDDTEIQVSSVSNEKMNARTFIKVLLSYFEQKSAFAIVIYILIFRLGDSLLLRQCQPFLMDPIEKGGMGVSVEELGIIYGTVGVLFLLIGGIFGGWLLSKGGTRKWLWPTALFQNSAILIYWWLALAKPDHSVLYIANSLEQFAYGLGTAAYTVFILSTVKTEYKAAHYAMATALMALGQLVPGILSGFIYEKLGYANFFLCSFLLSIPGMISIFYLPLWLKEKDAESS